MSELLAMLDAAIAEVGQKVRASSRSSRRGDAPQDDPGTCKLLNSKAVPALPVVPVKNDAIHDGTEGMRENTPRAASNARDVARVGYPSKSTGSTGSTGSSQDSCGLESARNFVAHGNYGNFPPSRGNESGVVDETCATVDGFDGVPMQWLNGLARMRATLRPAGIPRARWTTIIATAGKLLERWGSQLAALGWTAEDVFGADPNAPWQRLDCMGLIPLLGDSEVVAVTAEAAILKTRSGATQRFYRRRPALGLPLWELVR